MRFLRLELRGFRCFGALDLDLEAGGNATIFFGDNGAGKTSVIQALAMALAALPDAGAPVVVSADLRFETKRTAGVFSREYVGQGSLHAVLRLDDVDYRVGYSLRRDAPVERDGPHDAFLSALSRRVDTEELLPVVAVFPARREWKDVPATEDGPIGRMSGYARCCAAGSDLSALRAWWRWANELRNADKAVPGLDQVEAAVQAFLGPGADPPAWDAELRDVLVHVPALEAQLCLRELSDGYRNMVALVADVARRSAELNPHVERGLLQSIPGIVAVDELDLHLHPKWQREVLPGLRRAFPNIQWIITTHSAQVLASASSNEEVRSVSLPMRRFFMSDRDSNGVLVEMDAPIRPPAAEPRLAELYRAIDERNIEQARRLLSELEAKSGSRDREVVRARTFVEMLEDEHEVRLQARSAAGRRGYRSALR